MAMMADRVGLNKQTHFVRKRRQVNSEASGGRAQGLRRPPGSDGMVARTFALKRTARSMKTEIARPDRSR